MSAGHREAEFIGWTRSFAVLGRRVSKAPFIDQVPSLGHARLAASLGISRATLAATAAPVERSL